MSTYELNLCSMVKYEVMCMYNTNIHTMLALSPSAWAGQCVDVGSCKVINY